MKLPLFVNATSKVGLQSPKVMVPPGCWKLNVSDENLVVTPETTARRESPFWIFDQIGYFEIEVSSFKNSPITVFLEQVNVKPSKP